MTLGQIYKTSTIVVLMVLIEFNPIFDTTSTQST